MNGSLKMNKSKSVPFKLFLFNFLPKHELQNILVYFLPIPPFLFYL